MTLIILHVVLFLFLVLVLGFNPIATLLGMGLGYLLGLFLFPDNRRDGKE